MNIFYAPPSRIYSSHIELTGQEAKHASKVLRYKEGDPITIVDGEGGRYECKIVQTTGTSVKAEVLGSKNIDAPLPELVLAMGIIKKRDRLEFAVEKSVELGVSEIVLFRSRHTVKENVRMDRLEMTALSAMKQSLRTRLPGISIQNSLQDVLDTFSSYQTLVAHEKEEAKAGISADHKKMEKLLLLVGPEGGFSDNEVKMANDRGAQVVSLGKHRLRAETAAIAFLSQFI
ncbi:MAG: RsmE family RNA methyltransferase [Candidatus Halalkalibacterium sp. M3_1C_030]